MKTAEIQMKFVTPAILAGADQKQAEFRAPSLRGQLRWWMRAMGFEQDYEDDLFGTAAGRTSRSRVLIRTASITQSQYQCCTASDLSSRDPDYFLWPLRRQEDARGVIPAGTSVTFSMSVRGEGYEDAVDILKAFLLLGSLGTRSRRCYGSVWPERAMLDGQEWQIPATEDELATELEDLFSSGGNLRINVIGKKPFPRWQDAVAEAADYLSSYRCGSEKFGGSPSDKGMNDHNAGLLCGVSSPEFEKMPDRVFRPAIGLPLTQRYSSQKFTVETSIPGYDRFASPVHLKIVPLKNGFLPLAMFFPGHILKGKINCILENKKLRKKITLPLKNDLFFSMMFETRCLVDFTDYKKS